MAVLGKRQRLAVLRLTVNQFPSGKHWRFNSSLPHERKHPFSPALPVCEIILGYLDVNSKDLNCVTAGADWCHNRPRVFDRLVKWPRHHPFTVVTRVQISYRSLYWDLIQWQKTRLISGLSRVRFLQSQRVVKYCLCDKADEFWCNE